MKQSCFVYQLCMCMWKSFLYLIFFIPVPSSLTCALIWVPMTPQPDYYNTFLSVPPAAGLLVYATRLSSSAWVIRLLDKSDCAILLLKICQWLPIAFGMKTRQTSMAHTGPPWSNIYLLSLSSSCHSTPLAYILSSSFWEAPLLCFMILRYSSLPFVPFLPSPSG